MRPARAALWELGSGSHALYTRVLTVRAQTPPLVAIARHAFGIKPMIRSTLAIARDCMMY